METRTRNVIFGLLGCLIVVTLCAAVGIGAYFVTLRSATGDSAPDIIVEEAEPPGGEPTPSGAMQPTLNVPGSDATISPDPTAPPTATLQVVEVAATPTVQIATPTPLATRQSEPPDFTEEDLELLWEVWNIVASEFDGDYPSSEELTYAAIRGLLGELQDDYTQFAPPDVAERLRQGLEGSFEGIGAFVRQNEEGLTEILRPMDGQPAALAGMRAGDVVIAVDGVSVIGQSIDEVIAKIRGPQGTEVTVTVRRPGEEEPLHFTVRRQLIQVPIIESQMLEDNIAYIRLTGFNSNADDQLRQTLQDFLAQNPAGLIFDLRDNPGGFLNQSVAVADAFLPEGVVLYERSSTFDLDQVLNSDSGDLAESVPLVVLVNAGSASASEIVAGAIQDHGRGVLIGETTFGKGSVQQSHTLSDGSELRVTIARWYTPNDVSIDGNGIVPDIEVPSPVELGGEDDQQLQRAIEYLLTGE